MEAEYFVFCILYPDCQYSIFKDQCSIFKPQYLIFKPQYSIFRLPYLCYFHYLNNYDLPLYWLFFCKSHVRYCSLPRHNAFLCNEYYLMAEVVQKISNYKQNLLLVNCNRLSYLLVNVVRKRLELHSPGYKHWPSLKALIPNWFSKWDYTKAKYKQSRNMTKQCFINVNYIYNFRLFEHISHDLRIRDKWIFWKNKDSLFKYIYSYSN